MNFLKALIEFIVTFLIIYSLYYVSVIRKCKKNKKLVSPEVGLILYFYDIDIKKINLYQMVKVVSIVTVIILTVIITTISLFFNSTIIILIFGTLISILLAIICYQFIGRYYEKKSHLKNN